MPFSLRPPNSTFPSYLVPSLPFKPRKSSTDSNTSSSSTASDASSRSSHVPQTFLGGHRSRLRCSHCSADLAFSGQIVSKGFTGRHGRAYLVAPPGPSIATVSQRNELPNLPNTQTHRPVARQLVTGAHTVSDISCMCGMVLGWKYVAAAEESQQYKVGKFILETKRVSRSNCWEDDEDAILETGAVPSQAKVDGEVVEFDSEDEEECEELFMGVWSPEVVAKRRKKKSFMWRNV